MTATRLSAGSTRGIVAVVLLHAALLWLATRPVSIPATPDDRVWLSLLPPRLPVPDAAPAPVKRPALRRPQAPIASEKANQAPPPEAPVAPPPPSLPRGAEESTLLDAPTGLTTASPVADDIAERARRSAGAIDKQLRAELPHKATAPLTVPNARLIKGLAAAHAAVGPKWFEPARSELISAPNDPNRIYRITTALREYCLFYPNKASVAANSDTRGGAANFGQPTMADCPTPF